MQNPSTICVLTPPGSGAIAVVEIAGDGAWEAVKSLFKPAGKALPDTPILHRTWFGTLGEGVGDEVILAVKQVEPPVVEVHCHGGRQVVRWVVDLFCRSGRVFEARQVGEVVGPRKASTRPTNPWELLERAATLRTANILLDQANGTVLPSDPERLKALENVGRHLVEPWKVVIAGPPNVGKSSLVNALAGYQRSIVSPIAGTTRDVVTTRLAFDGWPLELSDTAGLRSDAASLEAEGIERAKRSLAEADLVVWVYDGSATWPEQPESSVDLFVINKTDCPPGWDWTTVPDAIRASATTDAGIAELIAAIVAKLVPVVPEMGEGVPWDFGPPLPSGERGLG
jgi:tRNA modification GTPase